MLSIVGVQKKKSMTRNFPFHALEFPGFRERQPSREQEELEGQVQVTATDYIQRLFFRKWRILVIQKSWKPL